MRADLDDRRGREASSTIVDLGRGDHRAPRAGGARPAFQAFLDIQPALEHPAQVAGDERVIGRVAVLGDDVETCDRGRPDRLARRPGRSAG